MENPSLQIGNGNWAVKESNLLGFDTVLDKYRPIEIDVTRSTSATRVNSSGLIETVDANIARIDYSNGEPSLLVEPQRTNLFSRSEEFNDSAWYKNSSTVTANQILAPNGTLTADLITSGTGNNTIQRPFSSSGVHSFSIFLKKENQRYVYITRNNNFTNGFIFDFDTNSITTSVGSGGNFKNYTNGWVLLSMSTDTSFPGLFSFGVCNNPSNITPSAGDRFYAWGAQLEVGSNATSYIPTTTASVTRNADVISKTGISDLIGQTEGTVIIHTKNIETGTLNGLVNITQTSSNRILLYTANSGTPFVIQVRVDGVDENAVVNSVNLKNKNKIAFAYKNGDSALYINGSKVNTILDAIDYDFPVTLDKIDLFNYGGSNIATGNVEMFNLFKTRLPNSELQQLTTL
jgi:hypothetical protein